MHCVKSAKQRVHKCYEGEIVFHNIHTNTKDIFVYNCHWYLSILYINHGGQVIFDQEHFRDSLGPPRLYWIDGQRYCS